MLVDLTYQGRLRRVRVVFYAELAARVRNARSAAIAVWRAEVLVSRIFAFTYAERPTEIESSSPRNRGDWGALV